MIIMGWSFYISSGLACVASVSSTIEAIFGKQAFWTRNVGSIFTSTAWETALKAYRCFQFTVGSYILDLNFRSSGREDRTFYISSGLICQHDSSNFWKTGFLDQKRRQHLYLYCVRTRTKSVPMFSIYRAQLYTWPKLSLFWKRGQDLLYFLWLNLSAWFKQFLENRLFGPETSAASLPLLREKQH